LGQSTLSAKGSAVWPVVVSVPHAGRDAPSEWLERARVPQKQLNRLSDPWCDVIAAPMLARGATIIKANLIRAVADCNRHETDMDPADADIDLRQRFGPPGRKARAGLGVIPARLPGLGPLWTRLLNERDYDARLEAVHRPFHRQLSEHLKHIRRSFGHVVLIDLHSMPPLAASRQDPRPAGIVIGDRFGKTAPADFADLFRQSNPPGQARVAVNIPYAGGHIIEAHSAPENGVYGLQVEFDRSLYLDKDGYPDADRAMALGEWLTERVGACLDNLNGFIAMAAE
jgi:N-formylglutamate amidohydrolase